MKSAKAQRQTEGADKKRAKVRHIMRMIDDVNDGLQRLGFMEEERLAIIMGVPGVNEIRNLLEQT